MHSILPILTTLANQRRKTEAVLNASSLLKRLTHECCINEGVSQSYVGKSVDTANSSTVPIMQHNLSRESRLEL